MTKCLSLSGTRKSRLLEEAHDVEQIRALPFVRDKDRYGVVLKRGYAQFGYSYVTVRRKLVEAPYFPDWLHALANKAAAYCPDDVTFNQAIITHYPPTAGIGWHTDAPRFHECIIGIPLVGNAMMQFRPNGTENVSHNLSVARGSLYVMTGPARYDFQHQIKPVKTDRYSLTLRSVEEGAYSLKTAD
jgi:DNA oxidative demethylase